MHPAFFSSFFCFCLLFFELATLEATEAFCGEYNLRKEHLMEATSTNEMLSVKGNNSWLLALSNQS